MIKAKVESNNSAEKDLEFQTKAFSVTLIQYLAKLPRNVATDVIVRQLLRSGTSIGANYREANRGVSRADFAHKIGIVQKEASETQYWIEILREADIDLSPELLKLHQESTELLAIFTTIGRKLKE
jgi:four helix bundle protein